MVWTDAAAVAVEVAEGGGGRRGNDVGADAGHVFEVAGAGAGDDGGGEAEGAGREGAVGDGAAGDCAVGNEVAGDVAYGEEVRGRARFRHSVAPGNSPHPNLPPRWGKVRMGGPRRMEWVSIIVGAMVLWTGRGVHPQPSPVKGEVVRREPHPLVC